MSIHRRRSSLHPNTGRIATVASGSYGFSLCRWWILPTDMPPQCSVALQYTTIDISAFHGNAAGGSTSDYTWAFSNAVSTWSTSNTLLFTTTGTLSGAALPAPILSRPGEGLTVRFAEQTLPQRSSTTLRKRLLAFWFRMCCVVRAPKI